MKLSLFSKGISLSRRLVFTVIIVSSITTFLLACIQIGFEMQHRLQVVRDRFTQVEFSYVANISNNLWIYSMDQIALQIDGLTRFPEIDYIFIVYNKKILIESGTKPANTSLKRTFELKRNFNGEDLTIGWLTIVSNIETIYKSAARQAATILFSNGIKTFIVAFVCMYIFQRLVYQPLSQVSRFMKDLRIDDPPAFLKISRPQSKVKNRDPDEMDEVEGAINSMIERIQMDKIRKDILEGELDLMRERHQSSDRIDIASEISASIGHEIKQPLFAIAGYSSVCQNLLENAELDKTSLKTTLQKIGKESTRANDIISNMKQLFERDRGNYEVKDIKPILYNTINMFELMLRRDSIQVQLSLPNESLYVSCNEIHIQQLFGNIILNAIQVLRSQEPDPTQGREIDITMTQKADNVEIVFADNGPGISKENIDKIFEAFYTSKTMGTGIGLSISRTIALYHDGKLDAFNNLKGGASFVFTIPLASMESDTFLEEQTS